MKTQVLSTLFVGIDVSSKTNAVCAIDFHGNHLLEFSVSNDLPGADTISRKILGCITDNNLLFVVIALESTSVYSFHIANFLASDTSLFPFNSKVFVLNPKTCSNFRKSYCDMDKTDPADAFVIADFARCGRISQQPWRASQLLSLQRLTRQRFHVVDYSTREKSFMASNIYLKFSSLRNSGDAPFSNLFGATASSVISDFTPDEICDMSYEDLINFIVSKGKGRFPDPQSVASSLKKVARDSYRLDKLAYDAINVSLASSFNTIDAFKKNISVLDKAIIKNIKGFNSREHLILTSIPGIGDVYSSGILSEIGSIDFFDSNNSLAKYAGLTWRNTQSGDFRCETTRMTKTGNKYLRYYLIEAAGSVCRHVPEFKAFYTKKYNEVSHGNHKRALALSARKLVRLIFGLLHNDQLFDPNKLNNYPL